MTVAAAVKKSKYAAHWQNGLGARRQQDKSAKRITSKKGTPISGSIDLDAASRADDPQASRWDYLIGVEDKKSSLAVFAEVHRVDNSELSSVLKKLDWLLEFNRAELEGLPKERVYYWVATKGVYLGKRERRHVASQGLTVVPRLELSA